MKTGSKLCGSVVLVLLGMSVLSEASMSCETGWTLYNGNCYKFITTKYVTKDSASKECVSYGASLPRVSGTAEINWLTGQMKSTYPSSAFWTDLNDRPKGQTLRLGTGHWMWGAYETADMSYISWNKSPANDGVANCAGVNIQGQLEDMRCNAKQGYICKLPTTSGCPLGWLPATDTACFWVSNTSDPTDLKNWNEARDACTNKAQGAQLLIIASANDNTFLTTQVPYLSVNSMVHWVGLQYANGNWNWYTNDQVQSSLLTWQTEPNNVAGIENCAALRMNGKFSDRACNSLNNFVCFKPAINSNPVDNLGCGPWIRAGKLCVGFLSGMSNSWAGARGYCQNYGGDLLKIDSIDKMSWVSVQMMDPSNDKYFWSGMNDQASEGNYVWADGTPVNTSFINWNREPNDYKGYEDCAMIYRSGQYNDMSCASQAAAICELDGIQSCPDNTWVSNGGNCYLFTPYTNKSLLYSQPEAASYCATFTPSGKVGQLLSVETKAEHDFIKGYVSKQTNNQYGYWTSLSDKQQEGFWQFATGPLLDNSLVDWTGEPSTKPGDNCGVITWAGTYHEVPCNWQLSFICERYATGVTQGAGKGMASVLLVFISVGISHLL